MHRTATPDRRDGLDTQWAETVDRLRAFVAARVEDGEIAADITQDVIVRSIASGALERVDVDGETHQHAADTLGLSVSGMKSRVQRARRELKQLLEQCCTVELDTLGAVADYRPNNGGCGCATEPVQLTVSCDRHAER